MGGYPLGLPAGVAGGLSGKYLNHTAQTRLSTEFNGAIQAIWYSKQQYL